MTLCSPLCIGGVHPGHWTGTGKQLLDRKTGFELMLSNAATHFTGFERDAERIPGLLVASNWTDLRVTWGDEYVSLLREGSQKPLLVQDFPAKQRARDGIGKVQGGREGFSSLAGSASRTRRELNGRARRTCPR